MLLALRPAEGRAAGGCEIGDGPLDLESPDCVRWHLDASGTETLDQVRATPLSDLTDGGLHLGYQQGALWLRILLHSVASQPRHLALVLGPPQLDAVDAWLAPDALPLRLGDHLPPSARATLFRRPTVSLTLQPGESAEVWIRIASSSLLSLSPRILDAESHVAVILREARVTFALLGAMAAFGGLFALLAVSGPDRAFGWYSANIVFGLLFFVVVSGLAAQLVPLAGILDRVGVLWPALASVAAAVQSTRHLHEDAAQPGLRRQLARLVLGFLGGCAVLLIALPPRFGSPIALLALVVSVWSMVGIGAIAARQRRPWGIFTVVAWVPFGASVLLGLLSSLGLPVALSLVMFSTRAALLWLFLAMAGALALRFAGQRRREADALARALSEARQRAETERELKESERLLQLAQRSEAIGRLAGGVAHDFNNLLTIVLGSAEEAAALATDEDVRTRLAEIRGASERAAALVKHLLAYSKRQALVREPVEIDAMVTGLVPLLERLLGDRVSLSLSRGAGSGTVLGDRGQIEQILVHLATNAREAMPEGGTFELSIEQRVPEGKDAPFVAITARDTGVGIPEAHRASVFEPFFTTRQATGGAGLGLSTSWGIAQQHGGWIDVASTVGEGAQFTVWLPLAELPLPSPAPARPPLQRTPGLRILLAEDDPGVRRVLQRGLASLGLALDVAADGSEALRMVEGKRYDLLVTDMAMPGATGAEVIARARQLVPDLPVVIVSGYAEPVVDEQLRLDRRICLVQKPCGIRDLSRAIEEVLGAPPG